MNVPPESAPLVSSVSNLRDLGGIVTESGRCVARGRLWRSSHFGEVSAGDLAAVHAIGFRTLVDLRGAGERERTPSRLAHSAMREVLLPIEPRAMGAMRELREAGALDEAALVEIMFEVYRRFVHLHAPVYSSLLRLLVDDETSLPLVFHCAAGKDRTGWGAALVLLALGVPRHAVVENFLGSNGRWKTDGPLSDWATLASVRADYLQCAFNEIDARWGSLDSYFDGPLGFDGSARDRLRARLLVNR